MVGSNFSDITEKGIVIQATIVLECVANPTEVCETHLEAKRLDSIDSGGFSISYAKYYRENNVLYRDLYHMKGVRVLFSSTGLYIAASFYNIVLQLASALGLIIASNAITDGIMLNLLKEKRHFKMLKVKEVEDMNNDD
jgi:ATP P2X receptor.